MDSRVGTTFGKYGITRLIGKGGMGEVFEAYDTTKGRTVALKILASEFSDDEGFRARFRRESQAAAILREPHVIPIHDWGEIDGKLYIDMRLVTGQTLGDILETTPLEPTRAVAIVRQIGAALDAAHSAGLIHRDVKPQNIIITDDDFAYLVDFGIAEGTGATRLTAAGTQIGTLDYMAPERFSSRQVTHAVDVYALACVLFEALTGARPFPGNDVEQQLAAHVASPPPRPSDIDPRIPSGFDAVIARGMAKDPDERYGSAGGLGRAAQRALDVGVGAAERTTASLPAEWTLTGEKSGLPSHDGISTEANADDAVLASGRRPRWVLPVAAVTVLALAGIGVIIGPLFRDIRTEDPTTGSADHSVPPLVTGPDLSRLKQTCDQGFALPDAGGFGSHGGRGTPETSCVFANGVLVAYWARYGNASPLPRAVSARGSLDCTAAQESVCDGSDFIMHCQQFTGDSWITCTGGTSARVYLW